MNKKVLCLVLVLSTVVALNNNDTDDRYLVRKKRFFGALFVGLGKVLPMMAQTSAKIAPAVTRVGSTIAQAVPKALPVVTTAVKNVPKAIQSIPRSISTVSTASGASSLSAISQSSVASSIAQAIPKSTAALSGTAAIAAPAAGTASLNLAKVAVVSGVATAVGTGAIVKTMTDTETENNRRKRKRNCILQMTNTDYEKKLPVPIYHSLFSYDYEVVVPIEGKIILNRDDKIEFACPGSNNYLTIRKTPNVVHNPVCDGDTDLKYHNRVLPLRSYQCQNIVKGGVKRTGDRCSNGRGRIYEIGHQITNRDWIRLIKSCYDEASQIPLYTEHVVEGAAINGASKSNYRPNFSAEGISNPPSSFNPTGFYTISSQTANIGLFINQTQFFAKGHLSSHADFALATSQYSTYFYLNAAPQWQAVNNGNWKSVENCIRKFASSNKRALRIITGTHQVLTLRDANNNPVEVYLAQNSKLPVPKFFWKIVYDEVQMRGIAFLAYNDPFLAIPSALPCPNICFSSGWTNANWNRASSGYVFCCDVDSLAQAVPDVPRLVVRGVLNGQTACI